MPPGSYSRTEAVTTMCSFYEYFTTLLSLDPSEIDYPPQTGWPEITAASPAGLNKNKDVIGLLKNIPYKS
jgi:hypothetical protein